MLMKYSHAAIRCTLRDVLAWQSLPVSSAVMPSRLRFIAWREQGAEIALKFPSPAETHPPGRFLPQRPNLGRGGCRRYKFGPFSMFQLMSQKAYHRGFLRPESTARIGELFI
jgi:hypothetical protein